jgi:hypothetical protein
MMIANRTPKGGNNKDRIVMIIAPIVSTVPMIGFAMPAVRVVLPALKATVPA